MGLSEDTRSQETALNSVGEWSGKIRNEEFLVEWRGVTRGHSEMRQNWIVKIFPRYYINTVRPKDLARNCTMWVFQDFMFSTMSVQSGLAFFVWNSVRTLHLGLNAIESLGIKLEYHYFSCDLSLAHWEEYRLLNFLVVQKPVCTIL